MADPHTASTPVLARETRFPPRDAQRSTGPPFLAHFSPSASSPTLPAALDAIRRPSSAGLQPTAQLQKATVRTASPVEQAHISVAYGAVAGSRPSGGIRLAETTQQSGKRLSRAHLISRPKSQAVAEETRPPVTSVPSYWFGGTYRGISPRPSPPPPSPSSRSGVPILCLVAACNVWGPPGCDILTTPG